MCRVAGDLGMLVRIEDDLSPTVLMIAIYLLDMLECRETSGESRQQGTKLIREGTRDGNGRGLLDDTLIWPHALH